MRFRFRSGLFLGLALVGAACSHAGSGRADAPASAGPSTTVVAASTVAPDVAFVDRRGLVVRARGLSHDVVIASGAVFAPRWSSSGQWLAYRTGDTLWVVRRDGAHRRRVSVHGAPNYFADAYVWSATLDALAVLDGTGVRIWWFSDTTARSVAIVPPVGGVEQRVQDVAWSRDSTSLVIAMERRTHTGPGSPRDSLWFATGVCTPTAPVSCAHPRQLRRLAFTPGPEEYPIFLAGFAFDNRDVLIWTDYGGSASILQDGVPLQAVPLDGGPPITIANTLLRTSWVRSSPDGSRLVIVRSSGRMVTDSREVDVCVSPQHCHPIAPGPDVQTLDPAWSPDSTHIAFVREDHASSTPPIVHGGPLWATKYRTRTLWIANSDGSAAHELTAAGQGIADPQFSPTGAIVFIRDAQLWQLNTTSGRVNPMSGSMRLSDTCAFDDCLPDVAVYETIARWSDHIAIHFAQATQP